MGNPSRKRNGAQGEGGGGGGGSFVFKAGMGGMKRKSFNKGGEREKVTPSQGALSQRGRRAQKKKKNLNQKNACFPPEKKKPAGGRKKKVLFNRSKKVQNQGGATFAWPGEGPKGG